MNKLIFEEPLIEGLIKSRPNRFIMLVDVNGKVEKYHCPSTGQIGSIVFSDIPCLISKSDDINRKTVGTVEAISLDDLNVKDKKWIGINQNAANRYVEFFMNNQGLGKMLGSVNEVKREVPLGKSRIDFLVNGKDYVEVKTPLKDLPCEGHKNYKKRTSKFVSFDRIIKHFGDTARSIGNGSRAIFLMCYIYPAKAFKVPEVKESELKIVRAARNARAKGLENWQVNLEIDNTGVRLIDCFRLNLF